MSDAAFQLNGVTREYGERRVLDIAALSVARGETLGLIGPTGAGKSTLLRLLAGLEFPTAGELRFGETRFDGAEPPLAVRRRIALVFQRPTLLSGSVRANVEYGLRVRGIPVAGVEPLLKQLGLLEMAAQPARTLSAGQSQLTALAAALAVKPDVLLLDEPTANLDPARVALVEEVVSEVRRQREITVVWATHNIFQARRCADRVMLLLEGRVVEVGPVTEFFEQPRDPRTTAFVRGEMVY